MAVKKKDLEAKIAELEEKLSKISAQIEPEPDTKPKETKPAPKPEAAKPKGTLPKGFDAKSTKPTEAKPKETKPAPKPEAAKPKGTLPKGFDAKSTKPTEAKPKETKPAAKPKEAQKPIAYQDALENAYMNAAMTDFHDYRAKVTGYSPAANRYFVRRTAPVGKVPTTNWNEQKSKVPGYTQPSNQYFATRPRLAYSPPTKTFGGFSGAQMTIEGMSVQSKTKVEAEPAKPKGTLPKGF